MLISFTLRNWRSFGNEATLSMLPTAERRFSQTLPQLPLNFPKKLLPIAAVYGANASGKTNLFRGLRFLTEFIVSGVGEGKRIPVSPNRLDAEKENMPTFFSVMFYVNNKVYEYNIELDNKEVILEELYIVKDKINKEVVFIRKNNSDIVLNNTIEDQRVKFVYEGTQKNLAFLTNAYKQKIDFVTPVYEWFKYSLFFIGVNTQYGSDSIFNNSSPLQNEISAYLSQFDTGISGLESKSRSTVLQPDEMPVMEDGEVLASHFGERLFLKKEGDGLSLLVLNAQHIKTNGQKVLFNFKDESDGTNRLLDLLPALVYCKKAPNNPQVFIVDEIDRSLHTNLLVLMISEFLQMSSHDTRFQLVFTTHNTSLMDQKLLRRDEMWITDKNYCNSTLYSISEFKNIRFDTILETLYKEGRFGGVPKIIIPSLKCSNKDKD